MILRAKFQGFRCQTPYKKTHDVNLSQEEGLERRNIKRDKLTLQPQKNKPGPKPLPPNDLVNELAGQGLSSREIARELNERGISVFYKTVQRRLQS
jgi:hypothetical protein